MRERSACTSGTGRTELRGICSIDCCDTCPIAEDDSTRFADIQAHLARERERLVEMQARLGELRSRAEGLKSQLARDRLAAAENAERVADHAEVFAAYLEGTPVDDAHRDQRLRMAERERERLIAAVERRNALRLRQAGTGPLELERLPSLGYNTEKPG